MFTRRSLFAVAGITLTLAAASVMALDKDKDDNSKKIKVGEKAPEFTAVDAEGKEHKLADFKDTILVLEWINPDCPYCVRIYEDGLVKKTVEELAAIGKDVKYVAVNSTHYQGPEVSKAWMEKHDLKDTPVLVDQDGTLGKQFDARTTPHVYVIDGAGVLRYHGAFDSDASGRAAKGGQEVTNYVVQAVKQIKANETVSPDYVKPWGCSVKYKKGEGQGNKPAAAPKSQE